MLHFFGPSFLSLFLPFFLSCLVGRAVDRSVPPSLPRPRVRSYLLERWDFNLLGGRHLPRVRPAPPEEGPPDAAQDPRPREAAARARAPVVALIVVGRRGRI